MIHVIAAIEAVPGCRDELLAMFKEVVPAVLAEDGCLLYDMTVDMQTDLGVQVTSSPDVFTVVEQWESLDALKAHMETPHIAALLEKTKDLLKGITAQILEKA